jgi:hypothetical protein
VGVLLTPEVQRVCDARQRRGAAHGAVVEPRGELHGDAPQRGGRLGRQRE